MDYTIETFKKCKIIQEKFDKDHFYSVMSNNNICLKQTKSITKAFEYAEWFESKFAE